MPLIYQKFIRRQDLRNNPDRLYVFGDNVQRRGLKGQAAAMRGEPNAVGVATKWYPSLREDAFFTDDRLEEIEEIISQDLAPVFAALREGRIVVWPSDGIGTGLSKIPQKAPKLWASLQEVQKRLESI